MEQKTLTPDEKFNLITRGIPRGEKEADFVIGEDEIRSVLAERDLRLYWGTATTGAPHVGYFVPIFKIADFLAAGCHVTILFADLHGFLDNMKSSWELLHHKCIWYESVIREMLKRVEVPLDKLSFVKGTSYQLREQYTLDMYKLAALTTTAHTQHAGAEVVKQSASPHMSNLMYPILQALDEEYLAVDMQFGGVDQRKIFMFAREWLPRIGYRKRSYVMNSMIPGLGKSGKMSSSEPGSKLELHDSVEEIRRKCRGAFIVDGERAGNGMLALLEAVLFRYLGAQQRAFECDGQAYVEYAAVEEAFVSGRLKSKALKEAVAELLADFLEPLRVHHAAHEAMYQAAYPDTGGGGGGGGGEGLVGLELAVGLVAAVNDVPGSAKHKAVQLTTHHGTEVTAVTSALLAPELEVGQLVLYVANAPHSVKTVSVQAHLVSTSHFDRQSKQLTEALLVAHGSPAPVIFGPADAPAASLTVGEASRILKTLEIANGRLQLKLGALPASPAVSSAVAGQLKM